MKNKLIKWGVSAALLLGTVNNAFSGILYSQKQVQQGVKLEQVLERIGKKYPKKQVEYFSRGFLQFKQGEFIQDSEIDKIIQNTCLTQKEKAKADSSYSIEAVNFNNDYCVMIEPNTHHIGDDQKSWFPIKKPEAIFYEKKFIIENLKDLKNPRLGIETFLSHADNLVYINGRKVGILPRITKKQWSNLLSKYKEKTPFLYGELDVSEYLKQEENILRIESVDYGKLFSNYNNFMIRRIQIFYNKTGESKNDSKGR